MTGSYDDEALIAALRREVQTFEPDTDRIFALVQAGGTTVDDLPRRRRDLRHHRLEVHGRGFRRALAWPAGMAAASLVILAVNGIGSRTPHHGLTSRQVGASATSQPAPTSSAPPHVVGPAVATSAGRGSVRASGSASAGPGQGGTSPGVSVGTGDWVVTIDVRPVSRGYPVSLSSTSGGWVVPGVRSGGEQVHDLRGGWSVGPVQVTGAGDSLSSGPFAVSWSQAPVLGATGVATPAGTATSTRAAASTGTAASTEATTPSATWVTVPTSVRGVASGLRVPVRFHRLPRVVTFLAGTMRGRGELRVRVAGGLLRAQLPACADAVCPVVVTVTIRSRSGATGSSGEVLVDLSAIDAGARIGLAAVSLG